MVILLWLASFGRSPFSASLRPDAPTVLVAGSGAGAIAGAGDCACACAGAGAGAGAGAIPGAGGYLKNPLHLLLCFCIAMALCWGSQCRGWW